jgi:hypothetical protein
VVEPVIARIGPWSGRIDRLIDGFGAVRFGFLFARSLGTVSWQLPALIDARSDFILQIF